MKLSSTGCFVLAVTWLLVSLLWFLWVKSTAIGVVWLLSCAIRKNVNERKYLPNLVRLGRPCNYTMDSAKKTAGGSQTYFEPKNAE